MITYTEETRIQKLFREARQQKGPVPVVHLQKGEKWEDDMEYWEYEDKQGNK